jgi:transcriptional regulator with XRE-family HTH domain
MDVANTLATARRRAGLTQTQLADRAGTSQATISAYESGRKEPSVETFTRLLAACGAHLAVAYGPERLPSRQQLEHNGRVFAQVLELAEALPARRRGDLRYPRLAA